MAPKPQRLAALLMAAVMAAPGLAWAKEPPAPTQPPVLESAPADQPAVAPAQGVKLAEPKVSREEAIQLARRVFDIPSTLEGPLVNVQQFQDMVTWRLEWNSPKDNPVRRQIMVEVDGLTGVIRQFYQSTYGRGLQPSQEIKYTRSEAQKLAEAWLDKLAADVKAQLRLQEQPLDERYGGNAYMYRWNRLEQGYPVLGQGVTIRIDASTGELQNFSREWQEKLTFPQPERLLPREKAEAIYRSLPLQLRYHYYQRPGIDNGEWRLVYVPVAGYPLVSQDGKLIDYRSRTLDPAALLQIQAVPPGEKPYVRPAKPLTQEEALAVARQVTGRTDNPTGAYYNEQGGDVVLKTWNFTWETTGEDGRNSSAQVTVDAVLGVPISMHTWVNFEGTPPAPKLTQAEARARAIAFLQQYRPDLAGRVALQPQMEQPPMDKMWEYSFSFLWLENGIPVDQSNMEVSVDTQTGHIRHFWANDFEVRRSAPFPPATGLMPATAAVDVLLKHQGLQLAWANILKEEKPWPEKSVTEWQLVWALQEPLPIQGIDARTGTPYDWQGRDLIQAMQRPADISGHFAEKEIDFLWSRGVLEAQDGKFRPDATASAEDLVRWLTLVRGYQPFEGYQFTLAFDQAGRSVAGAKLANSPARGYFGAALQNGIILPEDFTDEVDPAGPVSRELFALWVARALGYGPVAAMENRIEMPFADQAQVGSRYANAVALLHGLKVISGGPGDHFFPQRAVTRGEAAKMLYAVSKQLPMSPYWK
jgi:hypothetical protein